MGLKPGNGSGNGTRMPGVFINKDVIVDVQDVTGMGQFPSDVALKILFPERQRKDGSTFQPSMTVYGDFERDARGLVTGWGSAFKIDRLINHIGGWNQELQSQEVPVEALNMLIAKEVYHLQYCKGLTPGGQRQMVNYQIVAGLVENDQPGDRWLLENFRRQVDADKIKNYDPDAWDRAGNHDLRMPSPVGEL